MSTRILVGDCRATLASLADQSVQTCVSSPPYFGLRDYKTEPLEWGAMDYAPMAGLPLVEVPAMRCALGLETDPWVFVGHLIAIFREVRRVLRDDGTCWINLGDSYATNGGAGYQGKNGQRADRRFTQESLAHRMNRETRNRGRDGLKPKDLMMMPARLALALQADGWYLRQDIIWAKPNPMPESVTDRCTKSHEYLFLLSKAERYYFDADAIREDAVSAWDPENVKAPDGWMTGPGAHLTIHPAGREKGKSGNTTRRAPAARGVPCDTSGSTSGAVAGSVPWEGTTRNKRSVWTVTTRPFKGAHFATFPPALIEPCILAGSKPGDTVLDPFGGAGTTGLVADRLGRNAILCELNPDYAAMTEQRIRDDAGAFAEVVVA